jgi:hypothetical protein
VLFGEDVSYALLAEMLREGGEVETTLLSEEFDWHGFVRHKWNRAVPLFALTPRPKRPGTEFQECCVCLAP